MPNRSVKVIFDTNVWISFLIGKRLSSLRSFISDGRITVVTSDQLLLELRLVTGRKKLRKYFPEARVIDLIDLLETITEKVTIKPTYSLSRDPKDDFLFDLIYFSKADFLVTGDKDLLEHHPFLTAQILSPQEFEQWLSTYGTKGDE